MTIRLRCHKTDQAGRGTTIDIGRTGDDLCPVAAVLAFMAIHPDIPGSLFIRADGFPLSQEFLVRSVQTALASAGIDTARYNRHSFWIGAATAAAQADFPDSLIQSLGQWKLAAFLDYIRVPIDNFKNVSFVLPGRTTEQAHVAT